MAEHFVAEGLHYRVAGRSVIADVSLALAKGELVALIGPNGAEIYPAAPVDRFSQTGCRALHAGGQSAG